MAGRFWKEAASLIVIGRAGFPRGQVTSLQESDYKLLFLKRHQKSSFMPRAFVFPGGVTETSDFSLDWIDIFNKCGYSVDDLSQQFRNEAPLPEFYANKRHDCLLPEIGFRISALRETFEESGLLLTSHMSSDSYKKIDVKDWRENVHKNSFKFLSLFQEFGGCPALWDLHEWSGWLTPMDMQKRFDTAFYITFLNEVQNLVPDSKEVTDIQMFSPEEILGQWHSGSLFLPPPQVYEVSRLMQFRNFDQLRDFSTDRGKKGLQRCCPVRISATDGLLSVLPGDDLYPEDSDLIHDEKRSLDSSMEELRKAATCLHRFEIASLKDMRIVVNITPKYGHVVPLNYVDAVVNPKL